jgi:hypothetical protein
MTTCAVCQLTDGLIINVIVAEPFEPSPEGTQLVETPDADGNNAQIGGTWNTKNFLPAPIVDTPVVEEPVVDSTEEGAI